MNFDCFRRIVARAAIPAVLAFSALVASGQIFADFTTSMGSFTCQLDYVNAPKTTANFVGLATGQRPWLDLTTGRARTNAFYNGLTFHQVITNFMNQAGSPNGLGTDGPGYAIKDEFSPNLTFDSSGVLAMANSGPNSAGSQFFITVAPFAAGNNVYPIFGRVISGLPAVNAINSVATDTNDAPLVHVIIQQVSIRRVGGAAQAFDINAQGLPLVTNLSLRITNRTTQVSLTYSNWQYADNRLYSSTNLNAWTAESLGIETGAPATNTVYRTKDASRKFYRMAQAQYAASTGAPKTVYGRTLTLTFTNGMTGTMTIAFNTTGTGNYALTGYPAGTVTSYSWTQEPYRGWLWPINFSGLVTMTARLDFTSNTTGTFSGTFYTQFPFDVAGPFTVSGP